MKEKETKIIRLTRAEEEIMAIVWETGECVVKDVVDRFSDPKPAYTTVATVLRVLEKKGFVSYTKTGISYLYSATISKVEYTKYQLSNLLINYFNGSFPKMATFFARENDLSLLELEDILRDAQEDVNKTKSDRNE